MNYIEFTIEVAEGDDRDLLIAALGDYQFESFVEEVSCLKAYILQSDYPTQQKCIRELLHDQGYGYTEQEIADQNWNAVWESNFEAIEVEWCCCIRAPFHPKNPVCAYDIVIMPKMSFGTGHHATTYLMSAEILTCDFTGKSGLDMGSGTGVLSILSVMRGASHVDAIDIDAWAFQNGTENVETNGLKGVITSLLGDVTLLAGRHYDFVLANINRNILLADLPAYVKTLTDRGVLLVSGILEADIPAIRDRGESLGLQVLHIQKREGWVAIRFVKGEQ